MARKVLYLGLIVTLLGFANPLFTPFPTTSAQGTIQGLAPYAMTVYSRPDRNSPIVGVLIPQAKVVLEARTADTNWVLGHSKNV